MDTTRLENYKDRLEMLLEELSKQLVQIHPSEDTLIAKVHQKIREVRQHLWAVNMRLSQIEKANKDREYLERCWMVSNGKDS